MPVEVFSQGIQKSVIVPRVVMKGNKLAYSSGLTQLDAFLPRGVAVAAARLVFLFSVSRIVDHDVGVLDESHYVAVDFTGNVFGVGNVADGTTGIVNAISNASTGMVQSCGSDYDLLRERECVAGGKVAVVDVSVENIWCYGQERFLHKVAHQQLRRLLAFQIS